MRMEQMIADLKKLYRYCQSDGIETIEYDKYKNLITVQMTEKGFRKKFNLYEEVEVHGTVEGRRMEEGILFTAYLREDR